MTLLRFLKYLILRNPVKMTLLGISFLLMIPFNYYDKQTWTREVVHQYSLKDKGGRMVFYYVYKDGGKSSGYDTHESSKELKVVDSKVSYQEIHIAVVLSFLGIGISWVIAICSSLFSDDDISWNFHRVYAEALTDTVECEEEDNTLYYRFRGRLLAKQDFRNGWRRDRYSIILDVEHFLKNGANLYPEFMTKSERRNKKLRELFG